jgi:hypothetical protein
LVGDLPMLRALSDQAYKYASQHFTKSIFNAEYRKLLSST